MADSVDLWWRILAKSMRMPHTPCGRCHCYYLFVVLTRHLWHFQSIPAAADPAAVRRAVR